MPTKRATEAEITRVLRAIRSLPEDDRDRRTALLRDLAEATVSYREHFLGASGDPDWAGRTGAYRAAITELYGGAGFSPSDAKVIQKLARYHIANTLRERLSADDIEAIGLRVETPRERQAELRGRTSAILAAASASGVGDGAPGTAEERVAYFRGVLATLNALRPLPAEQRAAPGYAEQYETAKRLLEQIDQRARFILRTWPPPGEA
jgi:hypothetical protein